MLTLYLDMNVYKRPFDDQRQMRIQLETVAITTIFALIENGDLSAQWSFILDYENNRDPIPERKEFAQYLAQCCRKTIEPHDSILPTGINCVSSSPAEVALSPLRFTPRCTREGPQGRL